jgi:hypothetical protein
MFIPQMIHEYGEALVSVEFVVDKWHWGRFFSEFFGFPLALSFSHGSRDE